MQHSSKRLHGTGIGMMFWVCFVAAYGCRGEAPAGQATTKDRAQTTVGPAERSGADRSPSSWRPIDAAGVFAYEPGDKAITAPDVPPAGAGAAASAAEAGVRCRLVDYVDCTEAGRGFADDGGSRVLELPGGKFRVTAVPRGFELKWFSYRIRTADRAGRAHLLVYELSNDRERYTTVSLTVPPKMPWSPPYTGQERVKVDPWGISQEPLWYEPDVGLSVHTGGDLPVDGKAFRSHFVFYPKSAEMLLTVSASGWDLQRVESSGGAVSRVWVFEIVDELAEHRPEIAAPEAALTARERPTRRPAAAGAERRFGIYTTHPWYFLAHYGVPPHTPEQRRASLERMCDLMAFCGMNFLQFNAINGSDRAGRAWYPGSYYGQLGADLLTELPEVAAKRGIDLVPVVTSITAPHGNAAKEHGFSPLSFQIPADPKADPRAFENKAPDPLRPEVQAWLIRHLVEIAERSRTASNVAGVGFRVNGKLGTCYISGEDKAVQGRIRVLTADEVGYSEWNLGEFRKDSGLAVPQGSLEAYEWLRQEPQRWDRWLDFRCRRTHDFWLRARDAIRAVRPDWTLYVLTDLPSEVPATNIQWPGEGHPDAKRITLDLLRAHGLDPRMFAKDEGIIVQRVMMVDCDRYFNKWGATFGENPERYRDFHEQPFLPDLYRSAAGSAVELYHTYWEEPYHPQGEFGPNREGFGLRTATATAAFRGFFRPMAKAIQDGNDDTLVLTGWERPTLGHEHDLRAFAAAMRALPVVKPEPLEVVDGGKGVTAGWYGDRLGAINATDRARRVTIRLDKPLAAGVWLRDATIGAEVAYDAISRREVILEMEPWSLRTLICETEGTGASGE